MPIPSVSDILFPTISYVHNVVLPKGSVLFINEANRLVEGTQNVLLPALDEGIIIIPKIGVVRAEKGFFVIATQNPESYIGTTVLSEALKDRFVWVRLDYQDEEEEFNIVAQRGADQFPEKPQNRRIFELAVRIARTTREHPDLNRGASIRGAILRMARTSWHLRCLDQRLFTIMPQKDGMSANHISTASKAAIVCQEWRRHITIYSAEIR